MRRSFACILLLLGLIGVAPAQTYNPSCPTCNQQPTEPARRVGGMRVEADYLLWWLQSDSTERPLLGTLIDPLAAPPLPPVFPGSLADPNTAVLFGGNDLNNGVYSGMRLTLAWDGSEENPLGFEMSGFWIPGQGNSTFFGSPGTPPLNVLANIDGIEGAANLAANFGGVLSIPGTALFRSTTQLWGAEANGSLLLMNNGALTVYGLMGFRYAGLRDEFTSTFVSDLGAATLPGDFVSTFDAFQTSNQFYGGQLGARIAYDMKFLRTVLVSKVALGGNFTETNISGGNFTTLLGVPFSAPGGIFTSPATSGQTHTTKFSVISETNLNVVGQITQNLSVGVGYTFFYWTGVQRAGQQVNPIGVIDPALGLVFPRTNNTTNFWAHGVNFTIGLNF